MDQQLVHTNSEHPAFALQEQPLEGALVHEFAGLPQVRRILLEKDHDGWMVWIAAEDTSPAAREDVFLREQAIQRAFPDENFGFRLVTSISNSLREPNARLLYSRAG